MTWPRGGAALLGLSVVVIVFLLRDCKGVGADGPPPERWAEFKVRAHPRTFSIAIADDGSLGPGYSLSSPTLNSAGEEAPAVRALRLCRERAQCLPGSTCGRSVDTGEVGCFTSNCTGPGDRTSCSPRDACLAVEAEVFRCAPAGFAKRGERCFDFFNASPERRCRAGLLCVGGLCSASCDTDADCSPTGTCVRLPSGPRCITPGVLCASKRDCASDQACVSGHGLGLAGQGVCVSPAFADGCAPGQCPTASQCVGTAWGSLFFGRCYPSCTVDRSCERGAVCAADGVCRKACAASSPLKCGETEQCATNAETGDGVCVASGPFDDLGTTAPEQVFSGHPDVPVRPE